MTDQFDLFREPLRRQVEKPIRARETPALDDETMARHLEGTGRYRVLRKLQSRPVVKRAASSYPRLGVLVDTETTGLDHASCEIVELGMVAFTYDDTGLVGDVVGHFSALRQPYASIPPEVTRLTGITDDMVAGKTISLEAVGAFVEPADLIIAHNARFDRPFCERFASGFTPKAWACSVSEIDWSGRGFEGTKLAYLVGQCGFFHDGHRAIDDCHALLEVLARPWLDAPGSPFADLLLASAKASVRIFATNSPFEMKDRLKARGYRWSDGSDGRPKAWWTEIAEQDESEELRFLQSEICMPPARAALHGDGLRRSMRL